MAILKTILNDMGQTMHEVNVVGKNGNIYLNEQEVLSANYNQSIIKNATGFEIDITTLTGLIKSITEQKFFQISPSDYMPVVTGENAFATETLKYVSYDVADDFEKGDINTGAGNSRLAEADSALEGVKNKIQNWAKAIGWSLMDLQHAQRAGNFDLITSKEKARKTNWDLGIQRIAFLGHSDISSIKGLLTQANVNSNTAVITKYIKDMTTSEFQAFLRDIYGAYRSNAEFTAHADRFVIPELDFNGLGTMADEEFPLTNRLQRIIDTLKLVSLNPNFKVMPLAYADQVNNVTVTGLNKNRYFLYNANPDTVRMDVPVAYTSTLANTVNGFQYQNTAYGQYAGPLFYRSKEGLYFDWAV